MSKSRNSNQIFNYCKKNVTSRRSVSSCRIRRRNSRTNKGEKSGKFGEANVVESNQTDGELLVASNADSRAGEN